MFDKIKSLPSGGEQSMELAGWAKSRADSITGIHMLLQARVENHCTKWLDRRGYSKKETYPYVNSPMRCSDGVMGPLPSLTSAF